MVYENIENKKTIKELSFIKCCLNFSKFLNGFEKILLLDN